MHFLEGVFRAKSLAENLEFLSKLDVCYAPVHTLPEALDAAADKLLRDEHGRRHLAPPIRFRHEPARPTCASRSSASTTPKKRLKKGGAS